MSERPGQHADLDGERWQRFSPPQQILMIANEMNRARRFLAAGDAAHLKAGYERTLRLIDLTVWANPTRAWRRELLRLREVIAALYIAEAPRPDLHRAAMRALLLMNHETSAQMKQLSDLGPAQRAS